MGMSASQARLLSLQARMSDVEYEGQQINQQRLMLSNKMNEVMEKMTNMDVPAPPSKQDFLYNEYSGKTRTGKKISATMNDDGTFDITTTKKGMVVEDSGFENVTYGTQFSGTPVEDALTNSKFLTIDPDGYHECAAGESKTASMNKALCGKFHFTKYGADFWRREYTSENPKILTDKSKPNTQYAGQDGESYAIDNDAYITVPSYTATINSYSGKYDAEGNYYGASEPVIDETKYFIDGKCYDRNSVPNKKEAYTDDDGNEVPAEQYTESELNSYKVYTFKQFDSADPSSQTGASSPVKDASELGLSPRPTDYALECTTTVLSVADLAEDPNGLTKEAYDQKLKEYVEEFANVSSGVGINGILAEDLGEGKGFTINGTPSGDYTFLDLESPENTQFLYSIFIGVDNEKPNGWVADGNYIRVADEGMGTGIGRHHTGAELSKHDSDVDAAMSKQYYVKQGDKKFKKVGATVAKSAAESTEVHEEGTDINITNMNLDPAKFAGYYVYEPGSHNARLIGEGISAEEAIAGLLSGQFKLMQKCSSGTEGAETFNDASNLNDLTVNGRKVMSIDEAISKYGSDFEDALCGLRNTFKTSGSFNESDYSVIVRTSDTGKVSFGFCVTNDLKTGSGLATENDRGQVRVFNAAQGSFEEVIPGVDVTYDENGYIEDVVLPNGEVVHMEITQKVDEIEYDAAMNKYNIAKIEYDKEVNELNKQTSIYQRQDKQLELKLTRLDTERNALNTEIDAVKKVIQDATEKGFKTFSG